MKRYTFIDGDDDIIVEVLAENHDKAICVANSTPSGSSVEFSTDFYSETI